MKTEHQIQADFVAWARSYYPEVLMFAIPNGGNRDVITAKRMKMEGVLPGVPDLFIADGKPGLFIEMKSSEGRLSEPQKEIMPRLSSAGYAVVVCHSAEEAKQAFINYLESK